MRPRVLFFINSLDFQNGGIYFSLLQLSNYYNNYSKSIVVGFSINSNLDFSNWDSSLIKLSSFGPKSLNYLPKLESVLTSKVSQFDVIHSNVLWSVSNNCFFNFSKRHNKIFLISIHGVLNPVALKISKIKKLLFAKFFLKSYIDRVSCFHALNYAEYLTIRNYGIKTPVAIIPNGVEVVSCHDSYLHLIPSAFLNKKICLYIGRIHPIKGIELLIDSWKNICIDDEFHLIIAGTGEFDYCNKIINSISKIPNVDYIGHIDGELKSAWYRHASFSVLPSYSEAFPMTILESINYGTPVLATDACKLDDELLIFDSIKIVNISVSDISDGLDYFIRMVRNNPKELNADVLNAKLLVNSKYNWFNIIKMYDELYCWLRFGGSTPSFVMLD